MRNAGDDRGGTAAPSHTTLPRRGLLAGLLASLPVAAAAAPALAPAADAELLALVQDLLRQDEAVRAIEAEPQLGKGITAASRDKERRFGEADDIWFQIAERITEVPARSLAGLRAKASVMHLLLHRCVCSGTGLSMPENAPDADTEDRMAWSLAQDVLAGGFVPLINELTDQWAAQRRRMAGGA